METAKGSCLLDWAESVVGRTITIASCWCVSRRVLGHWRFWLLLLLLPLPLLSGKGQGGAFPFAQATATAGDNDSLIGRPSFSAGSPFPARQRE